MGNAVILPVLPGSNMTHMERARHMFAAGAAVHGVLDADPIQALGEIAFDVNLPLGARMAALTAALPYMQPKIKTTETHQRPQEDVVDNVDKDAAWQHVRDKLNSLSADKARIYLVKSGVIEDAEFTETTDEPSEGE